MAECVLAGPFRCRPGVSTEHRGVGSLSRTLGGLIGPTTKSTQRRQWARARERILLGGWPLSDGANKRLGHPGKGARMAQRTEECDDGSLPCEMSSKHHTASRNETEPW